MTLPDKYVSDLKKEIATLEALAAPARPGDVHTDQILRLVKAAETFACRAIAAEATIARVRHLHCRDDSNPLGPWCGTCTVPWPCQTWEALTAPAGGAS